MEPTTDRQWRLVAIYQGANGLQRYPGPLVHAETMADAIEIGWDLYATGDTISACDPDSMLAVPLRP